MIHANLHISGNTRITWNKGGSVVWVQLEENGIKLTIFVNTPEEAKRLVATLWTIRDHRVIQEVSS